MRTNFVIPFKKILNWIQASTKSLIAVIGISCTIMLVIINHKMANIQEQQITIQKTQTTIQAKQTTIQEAQYRNSRIQRSMQWIQVLFRSIDEQLALYQGEVGLLRQQLLNNPEQYQQQIMDLEELNERISDVRLQSLEKEKESLIELSKID